MPRVARYIEDNGYYHVISRSINQTWSLRDPDDFAHFRRLLRQAKVRFPIRLFHYALMNTHFHLIVQVATKNHLAQHVAFVKWSYTQWMRKKYGWRGPLWRERYKSLPIQNETYLAACGLYVECNPVRAGLCADPADYPYSSAAKYFRGLADDLVDDYAAPIIPPTLKSLAQSTMSSVPDLVFAGSCAIGDSRSSP
ncbi:MAG TPA: transposase [bacterium]